MCVCLFEVSADPHIHMKNDIVVSQASGAAQAQSWTEEPQFSQEILNLKLYGLKVIQALLIVEIIMNIFVVGLHIFLYMLKRQLRNTQTLKNSSLHLH